MIVIGTQAETEERKVKIEAVKEIEMIAEADVIRKKIENQIGVAIVTVEITIDALHGINLVVEVVHAVVAVVRQTTVDLNARIHVVVNARPVGFGGLDVLEGWHIRVPAHQDDGHDPMNVADVLPALERAHVHAVAQGLHPDLVRVHVPVAIRIQKCVLELDRDQLLTRKVL